MMNQLSADDLITHLQLQPHPEGGFYKEVYRSQGTISEGCLPKEFGGKRNFSTSIYYLLKQGDFSSFHRIKSDELWHFHAGGTLVLHMLDTNGKYERRMLGSDILNGTELQVVMPAGVWFAAEPAPDATFTLAGCTVAPGFDFNDFELASKDTLPAQSDGYSDIINRLCR